LIRTFVVRLEAAMGDIDRLTKATTQKDGALEELRKTQATLRKQLDAANVCRVLGLDFRASYSLSLCLLFYFCCCIQEAEA
jgi:hypothetical protein